MPECHNCPHNGSPTDACLSCKGPPETNHKGKTWVSLDATEGERDDQSAALVEASLLAFGEAPETDHDDETQGADGSDAPRCGADMPECCEDAARRALATVFGLSNEDLVLFAHRMRGGMLSAFGRDFGLTRQGAHQRWLSLMRRHPVLVGVVDGVAKAKETKPCSRN